MRLVKRIPAILRGKPYNPQVAPPPRGAPRLWNAKRRVKVSKAIPSNRLPDVEHLSRATAEKWRENTSQDVIDFIDQSDLLVEEKRKILQNPARWFSRPHNVPLDQRKQVYFPNFAVALRRTPHLGPYFASFDVPLHFNKLDMKSYLKQVYNVDVVHVRSIVIQIRPKRRQTLNPSSQGALFRPPPRKKMTVQLIDPFIWPEQVDETDQGEKDELLAISLEQLRNQRMNSAYYQSHVNPKHRKSIADQARDLIKGKAEWKPTWQRLPADARVLEGSITATPRSRPSAP